MKEVKLVKRINLGVILSLVALASAVARAKWGYGFHEGA
jgi:hypothetical protein